MYDCTDELIYQLMDFEKPHFQCQSYGKNGVNTPVLWPFVLFCLHDVRDSLHCCVAFLNRNIDPLPVRLRQQFTFWWHLRSLPCQSCAAASYFISGVAFP